MNDSNAQGTNQPARELIVQVLDAVTQRDWSRLPVLLDPEIEVTVEARPEVQVTINQHIWRSVHVQGKEQLRLFLVEFFKALPSLSLVAETLDRDDDCAWLRTEASGVDNQGSPFDARAIIEICGAGGRVSSLKADVTQIRVGADLLADADGDPRRFFAPFLDGKGRRLRYTDQTAPAA
jgi:hypothetical protein